MGYHLTIEVEDSPHANSLATPKTHTPLSRLKERGQRFYWPGMGRWLSRDPLAEGSGPNLYLGIGGDPLNRFDLLGAHLDWKLTYHTSDTDRSRWPVDMRNRLGYFGFTSDFKTSPKWCGLSTKKLVKLTTIAAAEIHTLKNRGGDRMPNPPGRTQSEHEQKHADDAKEDMNDFDVAAESHCDACLCVPCYDATRSYLRVLFEYYLALFDKQASDLDKSDYGGGSLDADTKFQDATTKLDTSRDSLNEACGYEP